MTRARTVAAVSLAGALGAALGAAGWTLRLPDVKGLARRAPRTTAYIELRRREAAARGRPFRLRWVWTPYERISPFLRQAVVTAEDDGFWRHDGIDWEALRQAWRRDLKAGRPAAGGSTIAMQLARNLYLSPAKNPFRKLKEMLIARRLEKTLGRTRVLELYLNVVEWGPGIFGCEAAARAYFGKSCADLDADESAALAAVLPNPRRWNPASRGPYVKRNSARIAGRLRAAGLWPQEPDPAMAVSSAAAASEAGAP